MIGAQATKGQQGRVVVVTGGAKGIGRYIAGGFVSDGATVVVVDIDAARVADCARESGAGGAPVLGLEADVSDEDEVVRMVDTVAERFGHIDVLVNNAGLVPHFAWGVPRWPRIRDMGRDFWEKVLGTNLGGTFLCTKHVLAVMEPRRTGHVLNLYGGGVVESIGSCAYAVSKDAIRTFTAYVAAEERTFGICIVIVDPGRPIATEDAPAEVQRRLAGPEWMGDTVVRASKCGLELSGELVVVDDPRLLAVDSTDGPL